MTDLEQRVAAALIDEGWDLASVEDLFADLAKHRLAITAAPDAEGAGLPPVNPDLIAVGSWGHYRPLKEADPAEYASLNALRRVAPPSSVDGEGLRAALDAAYRERNVLATALIRLMGWPAWVVPAPDAEGWWIVYAETPEGQVSWHVAPGDFDLLVAIGTQDAATWDGHTNEEKYRRIAALAASGSASGAAEEGDHVEVDVVPNDRVRHRWLGHSNGYAPPSSVDGEGL